MPIAPKDVCFPWFTALTFLVGAGAQAGQTAESRPSSYVEEIVVTAQQQKRSVQETLHSIQVFSGDELAESTFRNLEELLITMPNVEVDPGVGIIVRGVPERGYGGDLPTQLTLNDGFFSPGIRHFWDVEQVEILRGVQTTAGSVVGGTFGMSYVRPDFEWSGKTMLNWSPDTHSGELGLALGGPLVDEVLAFRLSVYGRESDGYTTNLFTDQDDWNRREERFYRAALRWQPDDTTDVSFSLLLHDQEIDGGRRVNGLGPDGEGAFRFETRVDAPEFKDERYRDVFLKLRKTFESGLELHTAISDHRWKTASLQDSDRGPEPLGQLSGRSDNSATGLSSYFIYDRNSWSFAGNLYAFLYDVAPVSEIQFPLDILASPVDVATRFTLPTDEWWVAGSRLTATWSGERWSFSGGLAVSGDTAREVRTSESVRLTSSGDQAQDETYDFLIGLLFPTVEDEDNSSDVNVSPMLAISYKLTPEATLGMKWERSYRAGWSRINVAQGRVVPYGAERADEFDLSLRSRWFDGRLFVNGNAFYTEIDDHQLGYSFSDRPLDSHIVNAGRSHNLGVELVVQANAGHFAGSLTASWLEAEFDEYDLPELDPNDLGKQLPNTPRHKFGAQLSYDPGSGFFASTDLTVRPQTVGTFGRADVTNSGRRLVNARIGWRFDGTNVELSLWARNLLDEKYLDRFNRTTATAHPGAPREAGVTLRSSW